MPAKSQAQRAAAGMALAAKRKQVSPDKLSGAARQMYDSMSEEQLAEFAQGIKARKASKASARK